MNIYTSVFLCNTHNALHIVISDEIMYNDVYIIRKDILPMNTKIKNFCLKAGALGKEFGRGDFFGLTAELSFYLLSSFLPMLLMVFTVASAISQNYTDAVLVAISALPQKLAKLLIKMLVSRTRSSAVIAITGAFSLFTLSGFVSTMQKSLNRFYGTNDDTGFFSSRITNIIFAFFIYISVIASFGLIIFGKLIGTYILKLTPTHELLELWNLSRYLLIFIFISFVVSALFKALPSAKLRIRDVIAGSVFTTVVWYVASMLFALYVNNFPQYEIIYGSLAGFACMIMWIYITSMSMLAGAKINAIIYCHRQAREDCF